MSKFKLNILLNIEGRFENKSKYIFRTYGKILGFTPTFYNHFTAAEIHLYYGIKNENKYPIHIFHNPAAAEFFLRKELYPAENINLVKFRENYVPFLFSQTGEIFHFLTVNTEIRKDIISSAFYFLSCWQEHVVTHKITTEKGYDFTSSLQSKLPFSEIAPVDRYCEILNLALKGTFPEFIPQKRWEKNKDFAITFSHNIKVSSDWNDMQKNKLKKITAKYLPRIKTISKIHNQEKHYKINSTYFVPATSLNKNENHDNPAEDLYKQQILNLLKDNEVNRLGSPNSGNQYYKLLEELKELAGFSAKGFRIIDMNFVYQELFKILEKAGLKYDSSMGFEKNTGFRAGISYPFYPYYLKEDRQFHVLEIPTIISDEMLFFQFENELKRAKIHTIDLLQNSLKHNSHLSISFSNQVFDWLNFTGWTKLYRKIINFGKKHNGWLCSLDEMYEYWKER